MAPESSVVIEIFGEGKTDVGDDDTTPQPPNKGVVPILVHALCGKPSRMRVKRNGIQFMMQKGPLARKVQFAKRQARLTGSAGAVFVIDSEGDLRRRRKDMAKGRRMELGGFPIAIGVAHPCIEAWLLVDASAIRRAMELPSDPEVPAEPEKLPAPQQDREKKRNPKVVLAECAGRNRRLSAAEKEKIAASMRDMAVVRTACPEGFTPFADEVEEHIRPLF